MNGVLELKRYKYTDVVLPESKVIFNGKVNIVDNKLYSTDGNISCKWENNSLSFSLSQKNAGPTLANTEIQGWTEPLRNVSNWPSALSSDGVINEFIAYVEADIAG